MNGTPRRIDLGDLGLERGGRLLVKRALREIPAGARLAAPGFASPERWHAPVIGNDA